MIQRYFQILFGVAAVRIALTNLLKLIGIVPTHFIGHSNGEIACVYADGSLTLKETNLAASERGLAILSVKRGEGAMAAIGIGFNELKNIIPDGVENACHNSSDLCTISGKIDAVKTFVDEMKNKNVFARIVDSSNVPFHSSLIASLKVFQFSFEISNQSSHRQKRDQTNGSARVYQKTIGTMKLSIFVS
jgi:fatty acid synthase, animal type